MTATEYLDKLRAANPDLFAGQTIKISLASFEVQLQKAFEAGQSAERGHDLFNGLFGRKDWK